MGIRFKKKKKTSKGHPLQALPLFGYKILAPYFYRSLDGWQGNYHGGCCLCFPEHFLGPILGYVWLRKQRKHTSSNLIAEPIDKRASKCVTAASCETISVSLPLLLHISLPFSPHHALTAAILPIRAHLYLHLPYLQYSRDTAHLGITFSFYCACLILIYSKCTWFNNTPCRNVVLPQPYFQVVHCYFY